MPDSDAPKIIVDSDWKSEAQKEKEELDRETREMPEPGEIPEPSIIELVQMVIMQASIGLGGFQDPQTGQRMSPNLPLARHYIDLLALLHEKTKNNLSENENAIMEATLHELRMAFVQMAGGAMPGKTAQSGEPGKAAAPGEPGKK